MWAQRERVITTIAGTEFKFPELPVRALQAHVGVLSDVVIDRTGNVYMSDIGDHVVLRLSISGLVSVYAGNGFATYSGDGGPAVEASLNEPSGLALDAAGNLYIADNNNDRVRRVNAMTGIITTVAGSGARGFAGDGQLAVRARMFRPWSVAVDDTGALYISDRFNHRVRQVDPNGIIRTIAGTGAAGFNGDNRAAAGAMLNQPRGLAFGRDGSLYIADHYNHRIRRINAGGVISTVAGDGRDDFGGDGGPGLSASIKYPSDVAFDAIGNIYIAEEASHRIRQLAPTTIINTVAGNGRLTFAGDGGPATAASLAAPIGVAWDESGRLYIADSQNKRLRVVASGVINTLAGGATEAIFRSRVPALSAVFANTRRLALDGPGNLFVSDEGARLVRRIGLDGVITTAAGNGSYGYTGDGGPATETALAGVRGMAVDANGNLFIADRLNHRVRRVDRNGIITNLAGQGRGGYRDGNATTEALLASPNGLAFGLDGALYVADEESYTIRRIANGIVSTVAGTGFVNGYGGDGGPASRAVLNTPYDLCFDPAGNLFIAELEGHRVRRVDRSGVISTVTGTGVAGYNGDGIPAATAQLSFPTGIACHTDGSVYVAEERPPRIRRIANGVITAVAGDGVEGFRGDGGPARLARFISPTGLALDAAGNLYIADNGNRRVRKILVSPPSFAVSSNQVRLSARAGEARVSATLDVRSTILPLPYTTRIERGAEWLEVSPAAGNLSARIKLTADPGSLEPGVYTTAVTIASPLAEPAAQSVEVRFEVLPGLPPTLEAGSGAVIFSLVKGGEAATQRVRVFNRGGGVLRFDAVVQGAGWLSVTTSSGRATNAAPGLLTLYADPGGLEAGTYRAEVLITDAENQLTVRLPVTATVSAPSPVIVLSQSGLTFRGVAASGTPLVQTVAVLNRGTRALQWQARAKTEEGGEWLTVTPDSGATGAQARDLSTIRVSVDTSRLEPGQYSGEIEVTGNDAANSPQLVAVLLNVEAAGEADQGPEIRPSELIFTGAAGSSPGSQRIVINNQGASPLNYSTSSVTLDGTDWLQYLPRSGTINAGEFAAITVQPRLAGLAPDVYRSSITLSFQAGGSTQIRTLNMLLVVFAETAPGGAVSARRETGVTPADGCNPAKLLPVFSVLGVGTSTRVGWPTPIEARVVDNCGLALSVGSVIASFSNGDPPVILTPLDQAKWSGTWVVRNPQTPVTVTLTARSDSPVLEGSVDGSVGVNLSLSVPLLEPGAAVSLANPVQGGLVAPGMLVSIRGSRLSDETVPAQPPPLPASIGGVRVALGRWQLPILSASKDRIDAIVPFDVPVNTTLQLVVRNRLAISVPEPVAIAASNPAVFVPGPGGYTARVAVLKVNAEGKWAYVSRENPLRSGDTMLIYAGGLGAVDQGVAAGEPAPEAPRAVTKSPVTVRIGQAEAQASFSGLAASLTGVYEIVAVMPGGVEPGDQVPLTVTGGGQTSVPVGVAVR